MIKLDRESKMKRKLGKWGKVKLTFFNIRRLSYKRACSKVDEIRMQMPFPCILFVEVSCIKNVIVI